MRARPRARRRRAPTWRLWQRMIDVNLTGAFLTVRAALPGVTRRDAPAGQVRRVVFVASTAGLQGFAYVSAYCAAKHGVVGLMRALALELARTGVTVNAVCPGYTETPMLEASVDAIVAATGRSRASRARGAGRGESRRPPGDASRSRRGRCGGLCTPEAAATTGQAIRIPPRRRRERDLPRGSRDPGAGAAHGLEAAAAPVAPAAARRAGHRRRAARAAAHHVHDDAAAVRRDGGAGPHAHGHDDDGAVAPAAGVERQRHRHHRPAGGRRPRDAADRRRAIAARFASA